MNLSLEPELEQRLEELARQRGVTPSFLVAQALRETVFAGGPTLAASHDEWEKRLVAIASDCGVSLPDDALTSEAIYEP